MKPGIPLIKQGWLRALLYLLAVVGLSLTINQYVILAGATLIITYLYRTLIDKKSFASLGFNWRGQSNNAFIGLFSAIAILGTGTLILIFFNYLSFIGFSYPHEIFIEIAFLIAVAFIEEIIFRGYILNNLMQSVNKWVALLISAIVFALIHASNPGISILPVINIFIAGLLLGINYIYTKNLWYSIFFHFAWNFMQGPVLGYEVSGNEISSVLQQDLEGPALITGGVFGFEGSLLCLSLLVIFTLWFAYAFSRKSLVSKI